MPFPKKLHLTSRLQKLFVWEGRVSAPTSSSSHIYSTRIAFDEVNSETNVWFSGPLLTSTANSVFLNRVSESMRCTAHTSLCLFEIEICKIAIICFAVIYFSTGNICTDHFQKSEGCAFITMLTFAHGVLSNVFSEILSTFRSPIPICPINIAFYEYSFRYR